MIIIGIALLLIVLLWVAKSLITPEYIGKRGEKDVSRRLDKLPESEYTTFNDVLIKNEYGTIQIDHIIVSKYGIFVVETKNYAGWIMGGENAHEWIQNIYGEKHYFRNPIQQNYGHVRGLMRILDMPANFFVPIVTFSERADIKVQTTKNVIYYSNLKNTILQYQDIILSPIQVSTVIRTIERLNVSDSEEAREEHVENIRSHVYEFNGKIEAGICPKCGGELAQRHGKYGTFIGCSNYPKCKFTKNLN